MGRPVTLFRADATSSTTDRIVVGDFSINDTNRGVFLPGSTTAAFTLTTNGLDNVNRHITQISRSSSIDITNGVPYVPPLVPVTMNTALGLGTTWFDLPASPGVGDTATCTDVLVPFFYDNSVVTSLGGCLLYTSPSPRD